MILDDKTVAFLESGVSISLAACNAALVSAVARALAWFEKYDLI